MFENTYVYTNTFMHAIKIDGKEGYECEGEQGGVLLLLSCRNIYLTLW